MKASTRTTLKLGDLLEIPIGIAPATGSQEPKFDTFAPDGAKRVQQFVHPSDTRTVLGPKAGADLDEALGEAGDGANLDDVLEVGLLVREDLPLEVDDVVKGLKVGDSFRVVPDSELVAARSSTKLDSVAVLEFIDYRRVPTDRLAGSHWVQPDPGFERPLATLMQSMRTTGRAMVVKYAVRDRQRLGVIRVRRTNQGDALLLNDVVFADHWREADDQVLSPGKVENVDSRSVAAAVRIIESMKGDGATLTEARDELPAKLTELVERAADGTYDDPARVLALAAEYREDGLDERAGQLVGWANARWPELVEKREAVAEAIASGEDVGEKLAAIVG